MAKRKSKKTEKSSKITNEELKSLQELVDSINRSYMHVGQLETQKHNVLHKLAEFNDQLLLMRDKFKASYGTDDVNMVDGTINYNEQAN